MTFDGREAAGSLLVSEDLDSSTLTSLSHIRIELVSELKCSYTIHTTNSYNAEYKVRKTYVKKYNT